MDHADRHDGWIAVTPGRSRCRRVFAAAGVAAVLLTIVACGAGTGTSVAGPPSSPIPGASIGTKTKAATTAPANIPTVTHKPTRPPAGTSAPVAACSDGQVKAIASGAWYSHRFVSSINGAAWDAFTNIKLINSSAVTCTMDGPVSIELLGQSGTADTTTRWPVFFSLPPGAKPIGSGTYTVTPGEYEYFSIFWQTPENGAPEDCTAGVLRPPARVELVLFQSLTGGRIEVTGKLPLRTCGDLNHTILMAATPVGTTGATPGLAF
jgi:hypothetical protein